MSSSGQKRKEKQHKKKIRGPGHAKRRKKKSSTMIARGRSSEGTWTEINPLPGLTLRTTFLTHYAPLLRGASSLGHSGANWYDFLAPNMGRLPAGNLSYLQTTWTVRVLSQVLRLAASVPPMPFLVSRAISQTSVQAPRVVLPLPTAYYYELSICICSRYSSNAGFH